MIRGSEADSRTQGALDDDDDEDEDEEEGEEERRMGDETIHGGDEEADE